MQGNRPPEFVPLKVRSIQQERGQAFGLVLFLVSALSLASVLALTSTGKLLGDVYVRKGVAPPPPIPDKFLSYLITLEIVGLVCIGATWTWRRWGIYGYFVANALMVILVFRITGRPPRLNMIAMGAMLLTALPRMHMFE
jgi:hypothetical protein